VTKDDQTSEPAPITVKAAGRGGVAIAGAKIYFILLGLVQQVMLKHILGLQSYGALGRVQSVASVVYNPIVSTSVQGVSRAVSSAADEDREATTRRVLGIHGVAIVPVALLFFLGAPTIAITIGAPHLTLALRIVSGVLFLYGLYTPLVGVLNGRKRFGAQAALDALFASLRTVGLLAGAYYFAKRGAGVEGALAGFVAAACVILLIALPIAGLGRAGRGGTSVRQHLAFLAPLLGGQLALNLLFQCDLTLLGRFAADAAEIARLPVTEADTLAGAYRNAQLFCFLPYQLLLSITFVLFPLLATAKRDGDTAAVARYTTTGVRLALIIAGAMVSVTASLPQGLLALVFGQDSAALGSPAMSVLALGLGSFAVFGILATVLTSLGREKLSAALTCVALALVVTMCFILVRGQPFGRDMLLRTAYATSAGLGLATIMTAVAVRKVAGAIVSLATVLRTGIALGCCVGMGRALGELGKFQTLAAAAGIGLVYLLLLIVTRELTREDLELIRRVMGRGKRSA